MGNCQAAEAAAALIHHPNRRVERLYCSQTATQVMASNPGHYVAVIVAAHSSSSSKAMVRYLTLLRPGDTLMIGHVYMLVTFEDVLREFGSKRRVRLSRLLAKRTEATGGEKHGTEDLSSRDSLEMVEGHQQAEALEDMRRTIASGDNGSRSGMPGQVHWRPTLQTIAEIAN